MNIKNIIGECDEIVAELLDRCDDVCSLFCNINDYIISIGRSLSDTDYYMIKENVWVSRDNVEIGENFSVDAPCIIEKNTIIRNNVSIRGGTIISSFCTIGNSVEVKQSILLNNVSLAHLNYVGNSIIGSFVKMGAGAVISNYKLDGTSINLKYKNKIIKTQLNKFGAIIGRGCFIGCNSVIYPGTIIEKNVRVYPLVRVKGNIWENSIVKDDGVIVSQNKYKKLFGTDGIRGIYGEDMNEKFAKRLGKAIGLSIENKNPKVMVGIDTRISSPTIGKYLILGLREAHVDVTYVSIVPTPCLSYLVKKYKADYGVMITASHNPYYYNGIKIIDSNGRKSNKELESRIENIYYNIDKYNCSSGMGTYKSDDKLYLEYVDYLVSLCSKKVAGLRVVIDCANGSAIKTAELIFEKIGCKVDIINDLSDGYSINHKCGATDTKALIKRVKELEYDCGISFDGDADRCIMVDANGVVIDGDIMLAIVVKYLKEKGKLENNILVGTVMSNFGLVKFCEDNNIHFIRADVGDINVMNKMIKTNSLIGGEQVGHIILKEYASISDGELVALQILKIMQETGKSLHELSKIMKKYPQVMVNASVTDDKKDSVLHDKIVRGAINKISRNLGDNGRVLVRASGTENFIRILVEGGNLEELMEYANYLKEIIENV